MQSKLSTADYAKATESMGLSLKCPACLCTSHFLLKDYFLNHHKIKRMYTCYALPLAGTHTNIATEPEVL